MLGGGIRKEKGGRALSKKKKRARDLVRKARQKENWEDHVQVTKPEHENWIKKTVIQVTDQVGRILQREKRKASSILRLRRRDQLREGQ